MEKATLHIEGRVAELMEDKGKLRAKIVCDTNKLLISIDNIHDLELGGDVSIEGEIKINSIQFEQMRRKRM